VSLHAELDQLHREAQELAQRLASARASATGTDPTGTVRVAVTGDGEIAGVTLDPAWRARFGPDGLAAALAAATADASHRRLRLWAERLDGSAGDAAAARTDSADATQRADRAGPSGWTARAEHAPHAAWATMPEQVESYEPAARAGHSEPTAQAEHSEWTAFREGAAPAEHAELPALDHLHYLVAEVTGRLRDLDRLIDEVTAPAQGSSADRRVHVTVTGGQVTAVELDRAWLRAASETAIAEHATQALRAAFAAVHDAPIWQRRAMDEVRALTADPAAFLRHLGLG
jgi:DNA-binding protein YbaB